MISDPELIRDIATKIVESIADPITTHPSDWLPAQRRVVVGEIADMIALTIPTAHAYSRAVESARISLGQAIRAQVERDDARSELARARRDIRLGAAVRGLVEQIERLRKNPPPPLDVSREGISAHVVSEVGEVANELAGSPAAQRECAGVIATSLHLAIAEESPLVRIIEDEADRLQRRLDRVEAGGTWEDAKAEESEADHSWLVPGILVEDCETWHGKVLIVRGGKALVDYGDCHDDPERTGPELDVQWWPATHLRPEGWRDKPNADADRDDKSLLDRALTIGRGLLVRMRSQGEREAAERLAARGFGYMSEDALGHAHFTLKDR